MPNENPSHSGNSSRQFASWLASTGASLAVTTYQSGKLLTFGTKDTGELHVTGINIERPMGLAVFERRLAVVTLAQIITFVDILDGAASTSSMPSGSFDALYIPQIAHITGSIDAHDLAFNREGRIMFVNTVFSCLARTSEEHSFTAIWKPPFVSRLAAEDRCHLNGLCLKDGRPAYVSAFATTDARQGWREHRQDGGVVVDVSTGEIVCTRLSMPHSPRVHEGELYVLNSGAGEFGRIDLRSGRFESIAFAPGFGRGLTFIGSHYAVFGLSKPRETFNFEGLPLQNRLEREQVEPSCGFRVVDLRSGSIVHWLHLEGVVRELYDVAVVPERRNPALIGLRSDEIRRTLSFDTAFDVM